MLASGSRASIAMSGASRPPRFKLSLPFLQKKRRQNLLKGDPATETGDCGLEESCHGDSFRDHMDGEQQEQVAELRVQDSIEKNGIGDHETQAEENDEENLTVALVRKYLPPVQLQNIKSPVSYKTYDVQFPPSTSPSASKKKSKTSSPKVINHPTLSGPLASSNMTTGVGCKSWVKTRCGYSSCSKQVDLDKVARKDRKGQGNRTERHRRRAARAKSTDPIVWERESEWSVLAEAENETVDRKFRRKQGQKKSNRFGPVPAPSTAQCVRGTSSDAKCSVRDPFEEVREAAKYDGPVQRLDQLRGLECDGSGGSHPLTTSTDVEVNSAEDRRLHPWERSLSSPTSDDELFTTSLEAEGQEQQRRKKWTSNSSDEPESRQRRVAPRSRSRTNLPRDSMRSVGVDDDHDDLASKQPKARKGSRIIFLSTPPRPKDFDLDNDDEPALSGIVVKCSTDSLGDYCKLDSGTKDLPSKVDKAFSTEYRANLPIVLKGDIEANAKGWSKLDLTSIREDDPDITSVRELPMISRTKETHHMDEQIEEQMCNLRMESDVSDSSQEKAFSLRGSRRYTKGLMSNKLLDHEKPLKKKRVSSSRRRKGRSRSKAPPLLPTDLYGKVKESVAVVKSSYDPYTDFRDSMVEMIVEKEIQGASDLEELLRCYLSLNSAEYHSVIVKVFADVWRELFTDSV